MRARHQGMAWLAAVWVSAVSSTFGAEQAVRVVGRVLDPANLVDGSVRFHIALDSPDIKAGPGEIEEMTTVLFEDRFDAGRRPEWRDVLGTTKADGGKLVAADGRNDVILAGVAEQNVRVSVEAETAAQMGILVCYQNAKNFVMAFFTPGARLLGFHEVVEGNLGPWIQPVSTAALAGKTVRMTVEARGSVIVAVLFDEQGRSVRTRAILHRSPAAGSVGLYHDRSTPHAQRFDNFRAERLVRQIPADAVEVIVPAAAADENAVWAIGRRVRVSGMEGKSSSAQGGLEKGDSPRLPERPGGCFAQTGTVPFFRRTITVSRMSDITSLADRPADRTLFPTHLPARRFVRFPAEGFADKPACGVVYRKDDLVTNGMPLGGIDTGCIDLETSGLLGYSTIFNTHVPRRGPMNAPILGLSVGGQTWVLCDPQARDGWGGHQPSTSGQPYMVWRGGKYEKATDLLTPVPLDLRFDGVRTADEIHYWGHYPVADLEFHSGAPVSVGLRAWSPFLPGDVAGSMLPGAVFEVHLRNTTLQPQSGAIAFSFPGPLEKEAGAKESVRRSIEGEWTGVEIVAPLASYALGVIGKERVRLGGELDASGESWAKIHKQLPAASNIHAGASAAVDFSLAPGESRVVRFVLAWHAPAWNAGGYNWAGAPNTFTHRYARHYANARQAAEILAKNHESLLRRVLAWQAVVYAEERLPVWLRESLVNVLHLITETGMWAEAKLPLPAWVRAEDGLFGMNECPRGCPQIECIPCSFYGNQPLVYFFPEAALSTLRGYKGYQYADGAAVWIFGGVTGQTPPIDFANPTRGYQFATNGISLAAMVDRYWLCHGDNDKEFIKEFFPIVKQNMIHTVNLRPAYPIGDRIIAMPAGNVGTEWFEAPEPGWRGMTAHVGGLHLAQLRIAERMARLAGDEAFARQCAEWIEAGAKSMNEKLWTGSYYLNYLEPETKSRSDLIFGYQLDGEWVTDHHGLASALPTDRVKTTLATIQRGNIAATKYGAVNYVAPDGKPAKVGGYGPYSYFPPEALMLAMNYMYEGQREFGLELARKVWHNIECIQGYTWDMPNIMRGDVDTGERTYGNDYYQDLMLWSLPAAIEGKDFGAPAKVGGLVERMLRAARRPQ